MNTPKELRTQLDTMDEEELAYMVELTLRTTEGAASYLLHCYEQILKDDVTLRSLGVFVKHVVASANARPSSLGIIRDRFVTAAMEPEDCIILGTLAQQHQVGQESYMCFTLSVSEPCDEDPSGRAIRFARTTWPLNLANKKAEYDTLAIELANQARSAFLTRILPAEDQVFKKN